MDAISGEGEPGFPVPFAVDASGQEQAIVGDAEIVEASRRNRRRLTSGVTAFVVGYP
jgi:hypothetical protein